MKTKAEQVKRAVQFKNPDYVPMLFFNSDRHLSDIIVIDVIRHFEGKDNNESEWGFVFDSHDKTMGQVKKHIASDLYALDNLKIPDAFDKGRFKDVKSKMKEYKGCYYIAGMVLSGFTMMTLLSGFQKTMEALYIEKDFACKLADTVFDFENNIIKQLKRYGFHAVAFYDDWGMQDRLMISPDVWRKFFYPRYKEQFELAHSFGLDVYFHSCGYIYDIIPDLISAGVDMLNISQPNLYDLKKLGSDFKGKVCFVCPVSYQTTSLTGSREDIFNSVRETINCLSDKNGGLIGYIEEYGVLGMSRDNYKACVEAFLTLGGKI